MAINTFTFGGITSSDYGIYVSGEGLFNAPKRDAEVVQIPGRDGDYILDKGSFENIEVTYRVFNQEKDLSDFRTKLANLRSALCSQVGYQRLTDTFHPNEYRMAAFIDGIEVNPVKYNTASEFEIKFNCKPQRFLTSGETAVSVASGGKVTNPTLFDSRPQLQLWGYGDVNLGSETISVDNGEIGTVLIANGVAMDLYINASTTQAIDVSALETGDDIRLGSVSFKIAELDNKSSQHFQSVSITSATNATATTQIINANAIASQIFLNIKTSEITFDNGTADSFTATVVYVDTIGGTAYTYTATVTVTYDGDSTLTYSISTTPDLPNTKLVRNYYIALPDVFGDSTKSTIGSPLYIDLDVGEAYNIENGTAVSVNSAVHIPPELPTLPSGDTTITYDNTVTQLKILPRWWKV